MGEGVKKFLLVLAVLFFFTILTNVVLAVECGSVPTSYCDVTQNTNFTAGIYNVSSINIKASFITLDCNNSIINGPGGGSTYGIIFNGNYNGNTIKNCYITSFGDGLLLFGSSSTNDPDSNYMTNNTFVSNQYGIRIDRDADSNIITGNVFENNTYGVYIFDRVADSNQFYNNNFTNNNLIYEYTGTNIYCINGTGNFYNNALGPTCAGLYIYNGLKIDSSRDYIPGNYFAGVNIYGNGISFDCKKSVALLGGASAGITIVANRDYNTISNCTINGFSYGIQLEGSSSSQEPSYNKVVGNNLTNNFISIYMNYHVSYNEIFENVIKNSSYGILTGGGLNVDHNLFYKNIFIDNFNSATVNSGANYWNNSLIGNYWSDYDSEPEGCYDNDANLICDSPYNLSGSAGNKDYLPLLGIQIQEITPIQVIPEVDLVKDKTTLVRSLLKNSGTNNTNITVKLYFEGLLKDSTNTTINAGEEKYVDLWFLPDSSGNNKEIKVEVEEI